MKPFKTLNEITLEDCNTLTFLIGLRSVTKVEVLKMEEFMKDFIDGSTSICHTCSGQIRFAHQRIIRWAKKHEDFLNTIRYPNLSDKPAETSTDNTLDTSTDNPADNTTDKPTDEQVKKPKKSKKSKKSKKK